MHKLGIPSPGPRLVSRHCSDEGLRLCLCVCAHQLSPALKPPALKVALPRSAIRLEVGAEAEGRRAQSPPQLGPGPGCHQGPASAFLQASVKPDPQLHVNTSCVKKAQLLLGQQTAVGLLGNRLAPPIRAPSHCLYLRTLCWLPPHQGTATPLHASKNSGVEGVGGQGCGESGAVGLRSRYGEVLTLLMLLSPSP